jgi:hypothetical protein
MIHRVHIHGLGVLQLGIAAFFSAQRKNKQN